MKRAAPVTVDSPKKPKLEEAQDIGLVWFRSDLRVSDNPALHHACQAHSSVIALYIVSKEEWQKIHMAPVRATLLLRSLKTLQTKLKDLHIPLRFEMVDKSNQVPTTVVSSFNKFNAKRLYFNIEYEEPAMKRDQSVSHRVQQCSQFHDQCIVEPGLIRTQQDNPFQVFTPFKNRWYTKVPDIRGLSLYPIPAAKKSCLPGFANEIPDSIPGFKLEDDSVLKLYSIGEEQAQERLKHWVQGGLKKYKILRDFPAVDGTSRLSPYLAIGTLSLRQCYFKIKEVHPKDMQRASEVSASIHCWIDELCWRDFYRHVTFFFPRVCRNQPFKVNTASLQWSGNDKQFEAWKQGRTGYPIVDAGMRQLLRTGFMHNRLRMIVAMFLTKDLLIDWRRGEQHFAEHLVDWDFSSNNGGWQWSSSTGTDSQPYFRIFNPYRQSERFDPEGEFIREYVPELKSLSNKQIHQPNKHFSTKQLTAMGYVAPIVEHDKQRKLALAMFKGGGETH